MGHIVERRDEVNSVVSLWKKICQGDGSVTFKEYYGIPGIGKTFLANQIKAALERENAACAFFNFDSTGLAAGQENPVEWNQQIELFKEIQHQWRVLEGVKLEVALPENAGDPPFDPRPWAQRVVRQVKAQPAEKTVVLICDETDHINQEQFLWLDEHLIIPLVHTNHCLIVWLGRVEKRWEIGKSSPKAKADPRPLQPFSSDTIMELLMMYESSSAGEHLRDWLDTVTKGHPMALQVAIDYYHQNRNQMNAIESDRGVYRAITEQVIQGYIFRHHPLAPDQVLNLSLLRTNEMALISAMIPNLKKPIPFTLRDYPMVSLQKGSNGNGLFEEEYLTKWLRYYYIVTDATRYYQKQRFLVEEYSRLCDQAGWDIWSTRVKECVYHAACANDIRANTYDLDHLLQSRLAQLESPDFVDEAPQLRDQLRRMLEHDQDLVDLIGWDSVDHLVSLI